MNKISYWFFALAFIVAAVFPLSTQAASSSPTVYLDGKQLSFDVPPSIINGRTLVPFRAIFEELGATLAWDGKTQTVIASKENTKIQVTVGEKEAFINGKSMLLDVPAAIISGKTMVPLRFVSEAMGATVDWEESTETIIISSKPKTAAVVERILSGDTLEISWIHDGSTTTQAIHLAGLQPPALEELVKESSSYTKTKLEGKEVFFYTDREEKDPTGRLLAYLFLPDGMFYNAQLIAQGYAQAASSPDLEWSDLFKHLQNKIKAAEQGSSENAQLNTAPSTEAPPI